VEKVRQTKNIEFVFDSTVTKLIGDEELVAIVITNKSDLSQKEISIGCLFIAIGQIPQNEYFKGLEKLDEIGYFDTDESTVSKTQGIFIAGDCRQKQVRQLTTAVSDGSVASVTACKYIDEN
jgi:thioredoxin reductase (NADPH)